MIWIAGVFILPYNLWLHFHVLQSAPVGLVPIVNILQVDTTLFVHLLAELLVEEVSVLIVAP